MNIAAGERELTTGMLSKYASFRVLVSGEVGVKEIERLIAKMELYKETLADKTPDYLVGNWHELTFTSDQSEQEIKHFASALKSKYEAGGMPKGCLARRHQAQNGDQTVLLSPAASALAEKIPYAKPLLVPVSEPDDPNNIPGFKPMGIFV